MQRTTRRGTQLLRTCWRCFDIHIADELADQAAMSSLPAELASIVQAGHIRTDPDPRLDIAPSTAADKKEAVTLESSRFSDVDDALDDDDDDEDEDIPYSVLRPAPRSHNLPPLPDLRFEQSYLHSISNADAWWKVLLITTRDQVGHLAFNDGLQGRILTRPRS